MTGNDMVVTNLFQVPTITETIYQQVQFNDLNTSSILLSCSFALLIGSVVFGLAWLLHSRIGGETIASSPWVFQAFELRGVLRWIGMWIGWAIVSIVALIPLANLIIKSGWIATMNSDEIRRGWSPLVMIQSIVQSKTFANEIGWSLQLSVYATGVAMVLGVLTLGCVRGRRSSWFAIGLMGFLLALPGPIVNLMVIYIFDRREPEWMGFLADRTLCGPIFALQSRCLPIVFGVLWLARERFKKKNSSLLQLDLGLPNSTRIWILMKAIKQPIAVALVVAFFVSFADLSSYLLVQPPQVTTVAMRMFDLLHYGIKNRESGLALTLVIASALPTWLLVRRTDW